MTTLHTQMGILSALLFNASIYLREKEATATAKTTPATIALILVVITNFVLLYSSRRDNIRKQTHPSMQNNRGIGNNKAESGSMGSTAAANGRTRESPININHILQKCRSKITDGDGTEALSLVLSAIRLTQGEEAIIGMLDTAKRAHAAVEFQHQSSTASLALARRLCDQLVEQDTLLSEMGREDILVDAFQDGSSVICQRCGALVPCVRMDAHSNFWCEAVVANCADSD